jgi:hypothetical protein
MHQLLARHWDGKAWQPLGSSAINADPVGDVSETIALAALPTGEVAAAWLERVPNGAAAVRVRGWSAGSNNWIDLPTPSGADEQTTLSMAAGPDSTLYLSLSKSTGMTPVRRWTVSDGDWSDIGLPEDLLDELSGPVTRHALAVGPDGRLALALVGQSIAAAQWDGHTWSAISPSVGTAANPATPPAIAVGNGGVVYIAWAASGAQPRIAVAAFRQTR